MTGGTGVLGSEMASALVRAGANVAILARDPSRADALKERLQQGPGSAILVQADILSKESVIRAPGEINTAFGGVHGLINAAGGNAPGATTHPGQRFFDLPEETLKQVVDLNLLGTIVPCQAFGRLMAESGEGNIINIASMAGIRPLTRTIAYNIPDGYPATLRKLGFEWTNPSRYTRVNEVLGSLRLRAAAKRHSVDSCAAHDGSCFESQADGCESSKSR